MQGVERTTAHFMSGLNLGGGIAWLGVRAKGVFARVCVRVVCMVVVVGGVGWGGVGGTLPPVLRMHASQPPSSPRLNKCRSVLCRAPTLLQTLCDWYYSPSDNYAYGEPGHCSRCTACTGVQHGHSHQHTVLAMGCSCLSPVNLPRLLFCNAPMKQMFNCPEPVCPLRVALQASRRA